MCITSSVVPFVAVRMAAYVNGDVIVEEEVVDQFRRACGSTQPAHAEQIITTAKRVKSIKSLRHKQHNNMRLYVWRQHNSIILRLNSYAHAIIEKTTTFSKDPLYNTRVGRNSDLPTSIVRAVVMRMT